YALYRSFAHNNLAKLARICWQIDPLQIPTLNQGAEIRSKASDQGGSLDLDLQIGHRIHFLGKGFKDCLSVAPSRDAVTDTVTPTFRSHYSYERFVAALLSAGILKNFFARFIQKLRQS